MEISKEAVEAAEKITFVFSNPQHFPSQGLRQLEIQGVIQAAIDADKFNISEQKAQ
jgi:hypothetical protein